MVEAPKLTTQALRLLSAVLSDPDAEWYGLQIAAQAGLKSGTVYVVLARLEQSGWLTSRWEEVDPVTEGRPRRRLYALTAEGRRSATAAIDEHLRALDSERRALSPAPAGLRGAATT